MNICSNGHSEIVYTGWTCPLCDLHTDLAQLRHEYEQLEEQLDTTETELSECHTKCLQYHSLISDIAPEYLL